MSNFSKLLEEVGLSVRQLAGLMGRPNHSQMGRWSAGSTRPTLANLEKVAEVVLAEGLRYDPPEESGLFRRVVLRCATDPPEEWLPDLRRCPTKREAPQANTHEAAPLQKVASTPGRKHPWTEEQWQEFLTAPEGQALQEQAKSIASKVGAMQAAMEAQSANLARMQQMRNRGEL